MLIKTHLKWRRDHGEFKVGYCCPPHGVEQDELEVGACEPVDAVNELVGAEEGPARDGRSFRERDNRQGVCDCNSRQGEPVAEIVGEGGHVGSRDEKDGEGNDVTRRHKLQKNRNQWTTEAFPYGDP